MQTEEITGWSICALASMDLVLEQYALKRIVLVREAAYLPSLNISDQSLNNHSWVSGYLGVAYEQSHKPVLNPILDALT
jgi:hypothetical protein